MTSLNHINQYHNIISSSFQHEYIWLCITTSSNLTTESLSIIAPAIHIYNRKHISHSTSRLNLSHNSQTIYQPPETSRQPNCATLRRRIREPDRDTWCLQLSCPPHVDPHVPMTTEVTDATPYKYGVI